MIRRTILYSLVFTCAVCLEDSVTYEKMFKKIQPTIQPKCRKCGAVLAWASKEKVEILTDPKTFVQIYCYTNENKDGATNVQTSRRRLRIEVIQDIFKNIKQDLDDFAVTSCNRDDWGKVVMVTETAATNKYIIQFKDTKSKCYKREVEVELKDTSKSKNWRNKPQLEDCETINDDFKNLPGVVIRESWTADTWQYWKVEDKLQFMKSDIAVDIRKETPEDAYTILACRTFKKDAIAFTLIDTYQSAHADFKIIDVVFRRYPLDLLYADSCSKYSLDTSIVLHNVRTKTESETEQLETEVYINYLDTSGTCRQRRYVVVEFDEREFGKGRTLKPVTIERSDVTQVALLDCLTQKTRGFLRALGRGLCLTGRSHGK